MADMSGENNYSDRDDWIEEDFDSSSEEEAIIGIGDSDYINGGKYKDVNQSSSSYLIDRLSGRRRKKQHDD
ncbi:hypothetical protein QGN29_12540 [Temperatibacter marinus]|uniref:Uncharacterized protein n=1 Tax=Temperatibacter marinus TaxID=1456591 RepID=A0AA52HAA0_9PROT|nr:hypothetical protein [Temperatibacter marinus]WND02378.1 hypothetical protein QGN29_12540 [Temperatibacter marinus]